MANLNKIFLMGNLTKDPELRYVPSGAAVCNLRLAANRQFKNQAGELKKETCFVTVVVWGKQAETCNQYLNKGSAVFVEGRLQSRSWETQDGQKRSTIEVRADRVQFIGRTKLSEPKPGPAGEEAGFPEVNADDWGTGGLPDLGDKQEGKEDLPF